MKKRAALFLSVCITSFTHAHTVTVPVHCTETNALFGTVDFKDTPYGLLITPKLSNLPAGIHGFHLHQHANCGDKGMGAGGHYDPKNTNSHQGPYGAGHLGDLPVLVVDAKGQANIPVLAPRLKTKNLKGLALMVHTGGDNYTDTPPLGGGGARIACGAIS